MIIKRLCYWHRFNGNSPHLKFLYAIQYSACFVGNKGPCVTGTDSMAVAEIAMERLLASTQWQFVLFRILNMPYSMEFGLLAIVIKLVCCHYWHGLNSDWPGSGFVICHTVQTYCVRSKVYSKKGQIVPEFLNKKPGFHILPVAISWQAFLAIAV